MGFISYCTCLSLYIMSSCLLRYSVLMNLILQMQAGVDLLDTDVMPIFVIIALDIVITLHFSINCSTVICSPIVLFAFKREACSGTYGPRVYFPSYIFRSTFICIFTFCIYSIKYQKYIYLIILSLSDLTFASGREGIDNPFIALVFPLKRKG